MPVYTVKFPLEVVPKVETFDVLDESNIKEVVKFNIKSTILTCPGERRGDPEFGVCAKGYLFNNQTEDFEDLRNSIINQIRKYIPYCIIEALDVSTAENNPNGLLIRLEYSIPDINQEGVFELILSA